MTTERTVNNLRYTVIVLFATLLLAALYIADLRDRIDLEHKQKSACVIDSTH